MGLEVDGPDFLMIDGEQGNRASFIACMLLSDHKASIMHVTQWCHRPFVRTYEKMEVVESTIESTPNKI